MTSFLMYKGANKGLTSPKKPTQTLPFLLSFSNKNYVKGGAKKNHQPTIIYVFLLFDFGTSYSIYKYDP